MTNLGFRLVASTSRRPSVLASWKQKTRGATGRNLHSRKELPYDLDAGLGEFLPPAALKTVAVEYQEGLLKNLNDEVRDTPLEHKGIAQTVIATALDRSKTLAFNYASLALNNSFFLAQLKPPPPPPATTHEASISDDLLSQMRFSHGDLGQFKSNFSASAMGMSSSGWIWFVTDGIGETAVLPTFGAGTLLVRSRMHIAPELGKIDSKRSNAATLGSPQESGAATRENEVHYGRNTSSSPTSPSSPTSGPSHTVPPINTEPSQSRFFHSSARRSTSNLLVKPVGIHSATPSHEPENKNLPSLGKTLYPLFCLSVYEHAWMSAGYGVWGKEEWLKKFWTVLDWSKVSANYERLVDGRRSI